MNKLLHLIKSISRMLHYLMYRVLIRYFPNDFRPYAFFLPKIRNYVVKRFLIDAGINIKVKYNADVSPNIKLGDNSELGESCLIYGGVEIGSDVLMGQNVKIFTRNHVTTSLDVPIRLQGEIFKPVIISNDIWICSNVVILPGVTIGSHSIIASGSVVTKSFPKYSVIGGNPAKLIRKRK
ncbi:MAG: acyltransferase [Colwellia polaris]